jgi:hypothetical protein
MSVEDLRILQFAAGSKEVIFCCDECGSENNAYNRKGNEAWRSTGDRFAIISGQVVPDHRYNFPTGRWLNRADQISGRLAMQAHRGLRWWLYFATNIIVATLAWLLIGWFLE